MSNAGTRESAMVVNLRVGDELSIGDAKVILKERSGPSSARIVVISPVELKINKKSKKQLTNILQT